MKYEDIECYGDDKKYESNHICVGKYGGYTYLYPCSLNAAQVEFSHFEDKYSKFCYTNLFGFNVSKGMGCLKEIAIDSSMAVSYDNQFFIGRNHAALKKIGGGGDTKSMEGQSIFKYSLLHMYVWKMAYKNSYD